MQKIYIVVFWRHMIAQGSKKMVRYLDSRIVSTRGERFTEIKKEQDEEKMKKTFINLKPAKQYRFHWQ